MIRSSILGLALGFAISGMSYAEEKPQVYVQIIVTACPPPADLRKLKGVSGYEPNYNDVPGDHKSMTRKETQAKLKKDGCRETPVPMELIPQEMTDGDCMGKAGYLVAMQYLENAAEFKGTPYVGMWECILSTIPFEGVTDQ